MSIDTAREQIEIARILGERERLELVELCTRIQSNAHAIPVRVNIHGHWENLFLSEMPAELAVWWAMQFVLRKLGVADVDAPPADVAETKKEG